MALDGNDPYIQSTLLQEVYGVNYDAVEAALEAGANVNGSPKLPCVPIMAAIMAGDADMIKLLLGHGANPDAPIALELRCPGLGTMTVAIPGERVLHLAARSGRVDIVRLLLKRSCADPNATDSRGRTPLMATCRNMHTYVEVVRLLLEAGADPSLAEEHGFIPLHAVALFGHMDLVDMLYSREPDTLNRCIPTGQTPLCMACAKGHESMVSKLLSLGAMRRMPLDEDSECSLTIAVIEDFVGVVRVMINEGGIKAIGGGIVLPRALSMAIRYRRERIFRLLLAVDGEERRTEWANTRNVEGSCLLHFGAGYCWPAAVRILLEAGADEAARDSEGRIPRDVVGLGVTLGDDRQMDWGKGVAIRRMLQHGPAYRARSWTWPSGEEMDVGGHGDGDSAAAAAAAAVLSSPPTMQTPPGIGVRIFRPKEKGRSKFLVRLVGR